MMTLTAHKRIKYESRDFVLIVLMRWK